MEDKTFELNQIVYILKKRYKVLILSILLITGIAAIYAFKSMKPSYQATIKIFAGKSDDIQGNYSQGDLSTYAGLVNTYIQLIRTDDFMNKVIDKAGLNMSPSQLLSGVAFLTSENTPIFDISYVSGDYETAEKVVKTIADEFAVGVREIILNTHTKVIDNVKVITRNPNRIKFISFGFFIGLIVGIGMIFFIDYLDDTIKGKKELEKILPIPVLGELPFEKEMMKK
ncbi:YveK family protein [Clostridium sardiniense]|uniref:YveK family protein n=1 Tax=Clostridium sardiniense TaxID=29369 RepID=UPI003D33AD60